MKRIDNCTIFTASPGDKNLKDNKVKAKMIDVTTRWEKTLSRNGLGLGFVYLARIVKSIPYIFDLPRQRCLVYCSCHYIADIIPGLLLKLVRPGSRVAVYLHHISPHWIIRSKYHPILPSFLTWFNQRLAILLIRLGGDIIFTYPSVKDILITAGIPGYKIRGTYCAV